MPATLIAGLIAGILLALLVLGTAFGVARWLLMMISYMNEGMAYEPPTIIMKRDAKVQNHTGSR